MGSVMIIPRTRQIGPIGIFVQSLASHKALGRTSRLKRSIAGRMRATSAT